MAFANIFEAVQHGTWKDVEERLEAGDDPNMRDAQQLTPLMYAARDGRVGALEQLLAFEADPNMQCDLGGTPLIYAIVCLKVGRKASLVPSMVGLLLSHGADPNIANQKGVTPLQIAALCGDIAAVADLLRKEADPFHKDEQGRTALDKAKDENIKFLLEGYMARKQKR